MQAWKQKIVQSWYGKHTGWQFILLPLSFCFRIIISIRRWYLLTYCQQKESAPVIVVGNITVGGTGKTPLSIALIKYLQKAGYRPGLVSRGYGSVYRHFPLEVTQQTQVAYSGDEPKLVSKHTGCPVVIDPVRPRGVRCLIDHHQCDVIVSDDGLQHYRLAREIEIVVLDGIRGVGNGLCLPAGPLREPISRLKKADFIVVNGDKLSYGLALQQYEMTLSAKPCSQLSDEQHKSLGSFSGQKVHAVAGIGHPKRFFDTLRSHGIEVIEHIFEDHHVYRQKDIQFDDDFPVLLTEKDAVKCHQFKGDNVWVVPVEAVVPEALLDEIHQKLSAKS